jgi:hypothetical protein
MTFTKMLFTRAAKTVIVDLNTKNNYYIDNHLEYYIQLTISLSLSLSLSLYPSSGLPLCFSLYNWEYGLLSK